MPTQVKERGEKFTGEEVRAILAGRKSMFRKVVKPQPELHSGRMVWCPPGSKYDAKYDQWIPSCVWNPDLPVMETGAAGIVRFSPYEPGMILWVREKWGHEATACDDHRCGNPGHIWYAAAEKVDTFATGFWRPSIHMPRWASRITLEVTDVRCERLHRIGHDGRHARDVLAEGIPQRAIDNERQWFHQDDAPAIAFSRVWDSINAKRGYSWESNPLVWCISFKRLENSNA